MSRSKWKFHYIHNSILRLVNIVENTKTNSNSNIKTNIKSRKIKKIWSRSSTIPSFLLGATVWVHNGKEFKKVLITEDKIGYKFGEFSTTRKRSVYKKKKNTR